MLDNCNFETDQRVALGFGFVASWFWCLIFHFEAVRTCIVVKDEHCSRFPNPTKIMCKIQFTRS